MDRTRSREGDLIFHQPARGKGYRANADARILADFAGVRASRRAIDLGAGAGAVGLALLHRDAAQHVVFVEVDPEAAALAERNLEENGWGARGKCSAKTSPRSCERKWGTSPWSFATPLTSNRAGAAPLSRPRRARARQGGLASFVEASRRLAGRRARVCFVYPAIELTTLVATLREHGLEP